MKRVARMLCLLFGILGLAVVSQAEPRGPGAVDYLRVDDQGFYFHLAGITHPCGSPAHQFRVLWTQGNSRELYALVLALKGTGTPLRVVSYSCTGLDAFTSDVDY